MVSKLVKYAAVAGVAKTSYDMYSQRKKEEELRKLRASKVDAEDVLIAGAGFSGICLAIKLKEAGIPCTMVEKAEEVGGTWFCNQYPGAACDIPAHLYTYSFERKTDWSTAYAPQPEILEYIKSVAKKYNIRPLINFNTEVTSAVWDEPTKRWVVGCVGPDGNTITYKPRFFLNAIGPLHVPSFPDVPGTDSFQGTSFHSAEWNKDYDFKGKKVCVVGSAASAVQLVPIVAEQADELIVLQRTPNWISKRASPLLPRKPYSGTVKWFLANIPLAERAYRLSIYVMFEALFWPAGLFNKNGVGQTAAQSLLTYEMSNMLNNDPALTSKVIPDYPVGCKRICKTDDYLPALTRDNVKLVTAGLDSIEPDGIVDTTGVKHTVDCIVYATGFKVGSLGSVEIHDRNGNAYTDMQCYEKAMQFYLGVAAAEFPNHFMTLGPNTALGHNSVLMMMESQVAYIIKMLCDCIDNDITSFHVKPERVDEYYNGKDGIWARLNSRVWGADQCNSWYTNDDGKIVALWPDTTFSYFRQMANAPSLIEDYFVESGQYRLKSHL